mgnify:CR=1 FL=1
MMIICEQAISRSLINGSLQNVVHEKAHPLHKWSDCTAFSMCLLDRKSVV